MDSELNHKPVWKDLVFDKQFLSKVDQLTLKRFGNVAIAEECSTYVIETLSKDNWERCEKYQGLSKPTTFLYSILVNIIEEFSRKKYGRPRPPVWLKNQGDLWVSLWRSLCLERQLIPSIIDRYSAKGIDKELITQAITVIKAKIPNCGHDTVNPFSSECTEDFESIAGTDDLSPSSECFLFEQHAGTLFHSMLQSILADEADIQHLSDVAQKPHKLSEDQKAKLIAVRESLKLTDQEKILIRMVYVDGISKSKAARVLNIPSHQGGKIVNSILSRIREVFEHSNLDIDSLYHSLV